MKHVANGGRGEGMEHGERAENEPLLREDNPTVGLPVVSPAHMIPVQVIDREPAAPGVVTVSLVLPGTQQAPAPYLPGQFVTLALPTPRETLYRSYSLCGGGDVSQPWQLTIKRLQQGAVSTYFYHSVFPGTLLYASLPRGTFTLPAPVRPELYLVMVATGSGITPLMGMLRALGKLPAAQRPLAQLHYASRSVDDIIFGDELAELDPQASWLRQWHYLSSEGNRMSAEAILARAGTTGKRAHWYMCGSETLKRQLQEQLTDMGVPEERVHSEVFATVAARPAYRIEGRAGAGGGEDGRLLIAETGAELDVQPQETLLTALERHGYRPDSSCRAGACGACKLRVLDGQVDPIGEALSNAERTAGYVLSCIARPVGAVTLASGGRPPAGVARRAIASGALPPTRGRAVGRTRVAALVGAGALLLGSWNLTNHRPDSWNTASASSSSSGQPTITTTIASVTAAPNGTAGASSGHGGSGGKGTPAATQLSGGGVPAPTATQPSGGPPAPTPTHGATPPTPTPQPKPTPTATSTPS